MEDEGQVFDILIRLLFGCGKAQKLVVRFVEGEKMDCDPWFSRFKFIRVFRHLGSPDRRRNVDKKNIS